MQINADFTKRVLVDSNQLEWQASPMPGVERRMLDRIGGEVAVATTIVRYAPKSHFSAHTHSGGEEFFVLEGTFQDEHGNFPAGSYVRNPPTSSHTPGSEEGCTIFVKLWQFDPDDRTQVMIDTNKNKSVAASGRPGVEVMPLFADGREEVSIEIWQPEVEVSIELPEGGEFLVLDGSFREGEAGGGAGGPLVKGAWLRLPAESRLEAVAGSEGARVFMKTGHIARRASEESR